ncbi:hypothetical protein J2Y55_002124 [Bosea sp. BE125]|uniref:hypothetical protein n=1 Tax=Bosea sp. BE125 TaxID=2817909 RepID=UPI00285C3227|nr:hypothetical protein [Bosea sp. BE125]MDR6871116.1 hypothetical protein [Bosea sp. BE125]
MKAFFLKSLIASVFAVATFASNASADAPKRGLYWNVRDTNGVGSDPAKTKAAIDEIKSYGVSEVHIWLNENIDVANCKATFDYKGPNGYFHPASLRGFTKALADENISTVYTLSPLFQSRAFLDSLKGGDKPLAIAAEFGGVTIELDLEYNWTEKSRKRSKFRNCADSIETSKASAELVKAIRETTPRSKIMVSTNGYDRSHLELIAAADMISPQLYGAHFAYKPNELDAELKRFMNTYRDKIIIPTLSAECSPSHASECSEAIFDAGVQIARKAAACFPQRVPGYLVWGKMEVSEVNATGKGCTGYPICSSFGRRYLRDSANAPAASCG